MRFAPSEFWEMTIKEANLVVKGDKMRQENDFMINYYAHLNAVGSSLSKDFKFINPFKNEKQSHRNKESSDGLKSKLNDMINNWR